MALHLMKETIRFEHQVGTGRARAVVEGNITLPGGLREAARLLAKGAAVSLQRVEPMQDRAGVSGRVTFHVLYTQGDPQRVQALEAAADFTHVMDLPGAASDCDCPVTAQVSQVEARLAGGQALLKAVVTLDARAVAAEPVEVLTGLADAEGLQIAAGELTMRSTAAVGTDEALLREEFDLPAELHVTETLFATACVQVEEVTGGAGRAGVSGQVRLEAYHATDLPDQPLAVTRHAIPFTQPVELAGGEGELLTAEAVVRDVAVASQDSGEAGRTLRAEVVLGLTAHADRMETLTILRDAYTTAGDALTLTTGEAAYRADDMTIRAAESGKALLLLPEDTEKVKQVLCAFAVPTMETAHQTGARLTVEGTLAVTLVAMPAAGGEPVSITMEEPFRQTFAAMPGEDDALRLSVTDVDAAVLTGDRVELRYVMHLDADSQRTGITPIITDAAAVPAGPEDGSIVLYFIQPGETLWDVAKRYRVAAADILRLNPEITEDVQPGQGVVVWHRCADCLCAE